MTSAPQDVSSRVTAEILDASDQPEWPFDVDLTGLDLALLRSKSAWVPWGTYLEVLTRLAGGDTTTETLVKAGIASMEYSTRGSFRHLGAMSGGLRPLYHAAFGWVMTSTVKCVTPHLVDVGPGRLTIELTLHDGYPGGELFFASALGSAIALPRALGQQDAIVEHALSERRARYEVLLPPSTSIWARASRAWSVFRDQHDFDEASEGLRASIAELLSGLRESNAALASSESRWRTLTEGLPGVVLVLGTAGEPRRMHGAEVPDEGVLSQIVESFRAPDRCRRVLEGGETVAFGVAGGGPGEEWAWSCRATRLPDTELAVLVAVDESEQQRTRRALRESEARYLQAQKMEALGRVAGGIAHDFNNLLTAVQGHAELLDVGSGGDAGVGEHTNAIREAVAQASSLTRQLLTYARRQPVQSMVLSVGEEIEQSRELLSRIIGDAVTLRTDCEPELHVHADASQLQQILLNLVVNARDAMPDGGEVSIVAEARSGQGEAGVVVSVCDEGTGMPREVIERATEPFFTTKEVGQGTGLGLSTVYWIVEQWGGRLEIESLPERGTCVRVVLPRVTTPATALGAPRQDDSVARRRQGTVLLVEDDPDVRGVVHRFLTNSGLSVVACADGAEALDAVDADDPPDLLLTDITMPGISGIELARTLVSRFPGLPVLLISGYADGETDPAAQIPSRTRFVAKPFTSAQLVGVVGELLER